MVNLTQAFSFIGYFSLKSSHSLVSWPSHLDSRLFWYLGNQTFPLSLDVSSLSQNPNCSYPNLLAASHKHLAGFHCESALQFRGATGANSRPGPQGLTVHHHSCSFSPHDRDVHADLKTQPQRYRVATKWEKTHSPEHTFGFGISKNQLQRLSH